MKDNILQGDVTAVCDLIVRFSRNIAIEKYVQNISTSFRLVLLYKRDQRKAFQSIKYNGDKCYKHHHQQHKIIEKNPCSKKPRCICGKYKNHGNLH